MPCLSTNVPQSASRDDVDAWLLAEDALVANLDNPASIEAREGYLRGIRASADATWRSGIGLRQWRRKSRADYFETHSVVCFVLKLSIDRLLDGAIGKLSELYTHHPEFRPRA